MFFSAPSSQNSTALLTLPYKVTETFLLPLRTVVASSSATRSSRSAQQSPPKSAAWTGSCANEPVSAAAAVATRTQWCSLSPLSILRSPLAKGRCQVTLPNRSRFAKTCLFFILGFERIAFPNAAYPWIKKSKHDFSDRLLQRCLKSVL